MDRGLFVNYKRHLVFFSLGLALLPALILILNSAIDPVRADTDAAGVVAVMIKSAATSGDRPADGRLRSVRRSVSGANALANGGFENGRDGSWLEYSSYDWPLIWQTPGLPLQPHGGSWAAWLGGDYDYVSYVSQDVAIPGGSTTLIYWNWIASEDTCGFDLGGVLINGTPIQVIELCEDTSTDEWVKRTVDLSGYAGQTVALQIRAETDGVLNSNFFVDDVMLELTPDATPVPTPKPTPEVASFTYLPLTLKNYEVGSQCRVDEGVPREYFPIDSTHISHAVKIDGEISSAGEWSGAECVDLRMHEGVDNESSNLRRTRWWVQNDGVYAYYLARVPKSYAADGVAVDYFWPEYNGGWEHSDAVYVDAGGEYSDLANWDEVQFYEDIELTPTGTVDAKAAVSQDSEFLWFEIRKELDSGDQYDWAVAPGQTVGNNPEDSFLFALIYEETFFTRNLQMRLGDS